MSEAISVLTKPFFVFFGLFGVVWTAIALYLWKRARQSMSWLQANATVLAAEVKKTDSGISGKQVGYRITYEPHITYSYSVAGNNYENDTYVLSARESIPTPQGAEAIVKYYTVGQQVVAFYDPADPKNSVLLRGGSKSNVYFLVFGFVMIAISFFGIFFWRSP